MPDDLMLSEVQQKLGLPEEMAKWLESLNRPLKLQPLQLPDDAEATELMERLNVSPEDQADTLAARILPDEHPELWWVLERIYHDMLANMGRGEPVDGFKGGPPSRQARDRWACTFTSGCSWLLHPKFGVFTPNGAYPARFHGKASTCSGRVWIFTAR